MTDWLFDPAPRPSLTAVTGGRLPVRRILCVGQNYAAHAREMGAERAEPFFFSKPGDALVAGGGSIPFPGATDNLHHEAELVCVIGGEGADLSPEDAGRLIWGYAVGVDLTRRDLQAAAKQAGRPWDAAKGFDHSAPVGPVTAAADWSPGGQSIALTVNGETRQSASLADMVWNPAEIVAQASRLWRVMPGDLIFTGTPEGVGPLRPGDTVRATVEGLSPVEFTLT
ncbi:fumarylacetoacetate hydrolase family protein [Brevundimonas lutea]|uniref:fumarylacetoacetate hydrolase family protein n=1 Tax=Brevundimonas lutea TaxID=2293980 RepID=UPI000F02B8DD|nr:fumarylacetoacetate hydrolase family protein [Brevundimonas lutea]